MILVADESVDLPIVERLRHDGHEVFYIAELSPSISDEVVLNLANEKQAPLVTLDKDFGELVYRQKKVHQGVILIRLEGMKSDVKADTVAKAFQMHADGLKGAFSVITAGTIRIRK